MYTLRLIAIIVGILSLTMQSSTDDTAEFAAALKKSGEVLRCAMSSCNKNSVAEGIAVMCNVGTHIKALKEITPLSLAQVATAVTNGSLAIEPKCVDSSYIGCRKLVPYQIPQVAETSIRTAYLLGCIQKLSEDDKIKYAKYLNDSTEEIRKSQVKDLECAEVYNRALRNFGRYAQEICF